MGLLWASACSPSGGPAGSGGRPRLGLLGIRAGTACNNALTVHKEIWICGLWRRRRACVVSVAHFADLIHSNAHRCSRWDWACRRGANKGERRRHVHPTACGRTIARIIRFVTTLHARPGAMKICVAWDSKDLFFVVHHGERANERRERADGMCMRMPYACACLI